MIKTGIILTGGEGKRLAPISNVINKHLLPVNNRFILDYPLYSLRNIGIENLIIIIGNNHPEQIVKYINDSESIGFKDIVFKIQNKPLGIAEAINQCRNVLHNEDQFIVMLGDNFFEKPLIPHKTDKAQVFLAKHKDLKRFGVASIDKLGKIVKLEEKPKELDSNLNNYAVSGCYIFNQQYFEYFKELKPSARNEYEIIEIIQKYLNDDKLDYSFYDGIWSDLGTFESIASINTYLFAQDKI